MSQGWLEQQRRREATVAGLAADVRAHAVGKARGDWETRSKAHAEVVDAALQANLEQVFFGATVTVSFQDAAGASEASYRIVGVDEADPAAGEISWISPLARALLKARAGDVVRLQSPLGLREVEVVEIRYE